MKLPFWHHLLSTYCEKRVGLSLPYLAGASALHKGKLPTTADAEYIVSEMVNNIQPDLQFHVSVCGMLKVPVFGILEGYGNGLRVSLGPDWGADDGEKLRCVVKRSEGPIREGTFSRVRGTSGFEWGAFTSEDVDFIQNVIGQYESS